METLVIDFSMAMDTLSHDDRQVVCDLAASIARDIYKQHGKCDTTAEIGTAMAQVIMDCTGLAVVGLEFEDHRAPYLMLAGGVGWKVRKYADGTFLSFA